MRRGHRLSVAGAVLLATALDVVVACVGDGAELVTQTNGPEQLDAARDEDVSTDVDSGLKDANDAKDAKDANDDVLQIPSSQSVVIFGERPGADVSGVTADTTIHYAPSERDFNYGSSTGLNPDSDPGAEIVALIRFDLRAIPSSRIVTSATLNVATMADTGCGTDKSASVHRVLEAWDEGIGGGGPGVANYNQRQAGVPWSGAGAVGASIVTNAEATFTPLTLDAEYEIGLTSLVQVWIEFSELNHGVLIKAPPNGDGMCLFSSESPNRPERRPILVVNLAPVDGGT